MPIVIRRPHAHEEEAELPREAPGGLKVPEVTWDWALTWRWRDIMENESYMAAFNKAVELVPETKDMLPILVDIKEGRTEAEKGRIGRAQKVVAKNLAHFMEEWRRFQPQYRYKSFDILKDDLMRSQVLWKPYEADRFRPPVAKETEPKVNKPKRKARV